MSALLICLLAAPDPTGQIEFLTEGTTSWVVPDGVYAISGVAVGGGGDDTGYGGANHWRNDIAVTPGETLSIQNGTGDRFSGLPIESYVKRGSTYLLRASHSTYYASLGGGGGDGGSGGGAGTGLGAGGAGGYVGRGGNSNGSGTPQPPVLNSGGGYSGSTGDGAGVGLQGRTPDFAPGSLGTPKCGGGCGEGQNGGTGGVRLMWGYGRSYPDNAADVTADG